MKRRQFINGSVAGGALMGASAAGQSPVTSTAGDSEIFLERDRPGQPHKGKVLAAIQPHSDDIPLLYGGVVAKLIKEGYTGILIRTSNSEMDGIRATRGEVILGNERDNAEIARILGCKKVFDLFYRNHLMDNISPVGM